MSFLGWANTTGTRSGNQNFSEAARGDRRQNLEVPKLNAAKKHKERKALIANVANPSIETVETIPDVFAIATHISEDQPLPSHDGQL